ncbi:MAG: hypothetical protein AAF968_27190, partial [Pseudomonadota bacterium]
MPSLKSVPLRLKLPALMIGLASLSLVAMGAVGFFSARGIVEDQAKQRLEAIADLQTTAIATYFEAVDADLRLRAGAPRTAEALLNLAEAFDLFANPEAELQRVYIDENPHGEGARHSLNSGGIPHLYDQLHSAYHPTFRQLKEIQGYDDV